MTTATKKSSKQKPRGKGGRPAKAEHEKRTASIRADLTVAEKEHVRQQAAIAGLSEAEFIRRRALGYRIDPAPRRSFDPALIMEVNELGRQVKAAGNLANQLALATHRGREFSADWRLVRAKVDEALGDVTTALRRLTGDHGS
jgi:hypothetical protein